MLLSHTVLSDLYQAKLVIEDEVKRMEGRRVNLLYQLIPNQYTKSPEVVTRIADAFDKIGSHVEARHLRGG